MTTKNDKLESLFKKEKNSTETPLLDENEIASILSGEGGIPFKKVQKKVSIMKFLMLSASILLVGILGLPPILHVADLKKTTNQTQVLKTNVKSKEESAHVPYSRDFKGDFSGIKMLELSKEELADFGISIDKEGIVYNSIFKSKKESEQLLKNIGLEGLIESSKTGVFSTGMRFFSNKKVPFKTVMFSPKMITDDLGMKRMMWYDEEDVAPELAEKWRVERDKMKAGKPFSQRRMSEYMGKIQNLADKKFNTTNNLIPVLIRTGKQLSAEDKKIGRWRPDCIFWYDATPEFIAALPERYHNSLKTESKAVETLALKTEGAIEEAKPLPAPQQVLKEVQRQENKVKTQEILIPEKEKRETGDSYFDVWRSAAGAIISTSVFPNPVRDQVATIRFVLKEERNIIITLHDIYGRRITELSKSTSFKSGEHSQEILLKDAKPGIYLLAIQTDKGEQAVQRVIVE